MLKEFVLTRSSDGLLPETGEVRLRGAAEPLPENRLGPLRGFLRDMEGHEVLPDLLVGSDLKNITLLPTNVIYYVIKVKSLVIK